MNQQNLFEQDWIDCLRAHYAHVINEHDENNEKSLVSVLLETGFSEDDIAAMRTDVLKQLGQDEEIPADEESTMVEADSYQWVLPPEVVKSQKLDESAYQWVLPPEMQKTEKPTETTVERPVEAPEAIVEPEESENSAETEVTDSDDDEEPPDSFVQMSLF